MSPRTRLTIGFPTLLMVGVLAGCDADTTIAVVDGSGGSGGNQGPSGTGGSVGGTGGVDGSADAEVGGAVDAEVGGTWTCCARDLAMAGCMYLGGSSDQSGGCALMCEFYCSENWRVVKDRHGCEAWTFDIRKPVAGEDLHCAVDRDAGADADAREAGADADARDAGQDTEDTEDAEDAAEVR